MGGVVGNGETMRLIGLWVWGLWLEASDHPQADVFRLIRGSVASRTTPTLEGVVSVSLEARARLDGNDAQRTATHRTGITAPRHHQLSGEDIGQIHSQQPNPSSSTVPTTPLTLPPAGHAATLEGSLEGDHGTPCARHHPRRRELSREGRTIPELEGAIPAHVLRSMDEQSSSPSPTLLVNPYYEQHVTRCIAPLLDVRPRGRNQDKPPSLTLAIRKTSG
nr:unnamed protein product [Digitaria exilis]